MSDAIASADRHLREALHLLQSEYDGRQTAYEREIAPLRQRIRAIEVALSPSPPIGIDDSRHTERALSLSPERAVLRPIASPTSPRDVARKIRGLTQPEALIRIAQEQGGVLQTALAKAILLDAGLIRGNPKNALGHVFQLLKNPDRFEKFGYRFEKIKPGEYRLMPTESKRPSQHDNDQEELPLGTPASAPHLPGIDFITVESPRN